MMSRTAFIGALFLTVATWNVSAQDLKIKGAELFHVGTAIQDVISEVMTQPMDQAEVDYFLSRADGVVTWAKANLADWKAVDQGGPDKLMERVKALGAWEASGIQWNEFFAFMLKSKMAQDLSQEGGLDKQLEQMKGQLQMIDGMLKNGNLPPAQKTKIEEAHAQLTKMVKAFENFPKANLDLYKANKKDLDRVHKALDSLDHSSEDAPGNEAPKGQGG
ncbi:MAG: hypothetical protein QF752_05105 [Planctomycetota bacterium]|nr:hypothetical protein [Planctomycetota bacterium]